MKLGIIVIAIMLTGCQATQPQRVRMETKCAGTVTIRTMVSDFGDGPVSGCAKRVPTGHYYLFGSDTEVLPEHLKSDGNRIEVRPEFWNIYGIS